ncbi:hypothetical protein ACFVVC_02015 [Pseudarthrobacter sp. NPDC058196]|uniref:hypothetical protein n=1 Tax=Pseudarthrobacter sp. NPDC058196 TaxID=3346376 RepID=UPI0036DDE7A2
MAVVNTCAYDARGRLMRPSDSEIRRARFAGDFDTGERPTFDRGSVHFFIMSTSGRTAEQAHERAHEMLARFFERAESVTGYRKLEMRRRQGVMPCNRNVSITYEILYAVEDGHRVRTHSPESPNAGYRRGRSAVAF